MRSYAIAVEWIGIPPLQPIHARLPVEAGFAGEAPELADIAREALGEELIQRLVPHEVQAHLDLAPADARLGGVVVRQGRDAAVPVQDEGDEIERDGGKIPGGIDPARAGPVDQGTEPARAGIDEDVGRRGCGRTWSPPIRVNSLLTPIRLTPFRHLDGVHDRELAANRFPCRLVSRRLTGDAIERRTELDSAKNGKRHGEDAPGVVERDQLGSAHAQRPDERSDRDVDRDRLDRVGGVEGNLDDHVAAVEDVDQNLNARERRTYVLLSRILGLDT